MDRDADLFIFDLDGTLTPLRASSTALFSRTLLPGVEPTLARLKADGKRLAIATNQGGCDPTRPGRLSVGAVHAHLRWVRGALGIDAVRFAVAPGRKKPYPAMLNELVEVFGVARRRTVFVGDHASDEGAARAAGVRFVHAADFFGSSAGTG